MQNDDKFSQDSRPDSPAERFSQILSNQISSYSRRQESLKKYSNRLSATHLLFSTVTVACIAANAHFQTVFLTLAAIFCSLTSVGASQFLHYFNFQERLQLASNTRSKLRALQTEYELWKSGQEFDIEKKGEKALEEIDEFRQNMQALLDDQNGSWNTQMTQSISNARKGAPSADFKSIQP